MSTTQHIEISIDSYLTGLKEGRALAKSEFAQKLRNAIHEGDDANGNAQRLIELCGNWVNEP